MSSNDFDQICYGVRAHTLLVLYNLTRKTIWFYDVYKKVIMNSYEQWNQYGTVLNVLRAFVSGFGLTVTTRLNI